MKKHTCLITGVSSGLGKALAHEAAKVGYFVIGTFRRADQVQTFKEENSKNATAYQLDLADPQSVRALVYQLEQADQLPDVLINNAGMGFTGAIEETSPTEYRQVFETNFFGTLELTRLLLPHFRAQGSGSIIQISSHGGIKAFAGFGIYNASKFALEGFSEALQQELAPLGIRVHLVEPGPFRTRFASEKLGIVQKQIAAYQETAGAFTNKLKLVDGKQEGDPDKAAKAILEMLDKPDAPFRLPLGKIACQTIAAKLNSVQHDLEANRAIAESAVY